MTANRKVTARYAEIARFLGLHFNEEFCVAYGEKDGFTLRVSGLDTGRGIEYGMVCSWNLPADSPQPVCDRGTAFLSLWRDQLSGRSDVGV